MADTSPARIALYVASEAVAPGASNLLKGNYKQGLLHAIAGAAAAAVYGPAGALLVAADSVHKAVTGVNLYDRVGLFQEVRPSSALEVEDDSRGEVKAADAGVKTADAGVKTADAGVKAADAGASGRRRPPKET